jgi:predicted GIY-YIG superfamily endonuclease
MARFWVYILFNASGELYVGQTSCLGLRLWEHNQGLTPSNRSGRPWRLLYIFPCGSRANALRMESNYQAYVSKYHRLPFIRDRADGYELLLRLVLG